MAAETRVAVYTDTDDTDVRLGVSMLEAAGFTVRRLETRDEASIIEGAKDAAVLLVGYAPITRAIIESLPSLRLVALMSMGVDGVDVEAAAEHDVWVTNVPGAATEEVATHALAIALHAVRGLTASRASATPERWHERAPIAPPRLSETTLGIVGLGRIGRELARIARPLFGRIVGFDPLLPDTTDVRADLDGLGIERSSLEAVRARADVLSLHLPLTAATDRLVDADFLAAMPAGSVLVNVSRGGLIDEPALVAALDAGHLAGAALDVLVDEPPLAGNPLVGRPDVVLTPHVAYWSRRTESEYVRIQAQNAISWAATGAPESPVPAPQRPGAPLVPGSTSAAS